MIKHYSINVRTGWIALLVALSWGSAACGAVVVHNANLESQPLDWSLGVNLPQFDEGIGTLRSVELRITGNLSGLLGVENLEDKFNSVQGTLAGVYSIFDVLESEVLSLSLFQADTMLLEPFDGVLDYDGLSGYTFDSLAASGQQSVIYQASGMDLSAFIGSSTLFYSIITEDLSTASSGAGTPAYYSALDGWGSFQIRYTYDSGGDLALIPEPGNLMPIACIVALCLIARHVRRERRTS